MERESIIGGVVLYLRGCPAIRVGLCPSALRSVLRFDEEDIEFCDAYCTSPSKPTPQPHPSITPSPTPIPPTALTVCLGQEPASLYPVNNPSSTARTILSALYDGPIDTNAYTYQPVILETLPSLENGDAELFQVGVYTGEEVVNTDGLPVTLEAGIRIRPAGCRSDECAIEYDGRSEVQMDQMAVTFRLIPGLTWSDGEPLTAQDSVYAYLVAHSLGGDYLVARTQSYEAADDLTVQWWGRPGYIDPTYMTNFFFPFPYHIWSDIPYDELADSEAASLNPLGWGPYVIDEWHSGVSITLVKNPRYFRQAEGLPYIDSLTFRFTSSPEDALAALLAGECDLIDSSLPLDEQVAMLQSLQADEQLQAYFSTSPVMEQLAFGILTAEYDNGYNPAYDRPNYFADARVRQAVAMCIDHQAIIDTVLYGLSSLPGSYVPGEHPLFDTSASLPSFDPAAANDLLAEAGWLDPDGDPATPRLSSALTGLPAGTPFSVTLVTTPATQRLQVSSLLPGGQQPRHLLSRSRRR